LPAVARVPNPVPSGKHPEQCEVEEEPETVPSFRQGPTDGSADRTYSHDCHCRYSMDDLYGNAWGDPANDYPSNPTYPLPTWNAQPPSPEPSSPVKDDQNETQADDDENKGLTEPQSRDDAPGTSWTTGAAPLSAGQSQDQYYSAWAPTPPVNVWSSTAQTPTVLTSTPDGVESEPPPSPTLLEEPKEGDPLPSEQTQGTPIHSRTPSPDQFGTFESGDTDVTIPVERGGWDSPKYSTFDDAVDSSDAWGQQAATKECDTEAEPADEWEAARRMKEKLDRRVVRMPS